MVLVVLLSSICSEVPLPATEALFAPPRHLYITNTFSKVAMVPVMKQVGSVEEEDLELGVLKPLSHQSTSGSVVSTKQSHERVTGWNPG